MQFKLHYNLKCINFVLLWGECYKYCKIDSNLINMSYCKTVHLKNIVNHWTDKHCKQSQTKVGVTWELGNKHLPPLIYNESNFLNILKVLMRNLVFRSMLLAHKSNKLSHNHARARCQRGRRRDAKQCFSSSDERKMVSIIQRRLWRTCTLSKNLNLTFDLDIILWHIW